jgi:hypothetical protein
MKLLITPILFLVFIFSFSSQLNAQVVFITTQEQIDNFDLTVVTGALHISGSAIKNLNGLNTLTTINTLYIAETEISSLSGLQNLSSIEELYLLDNQYLLNTTALNSVKSGNYIYINNNNSLQGIEVKNLEGPVTGSSAFRWIEISENSSLISMVFPKLSSTNLLLIKDNPKLTDINLLELANVGRYSTSVSLEVNRNTMLSNFCTFFNLFSGGGLIGYYTISGNAANPSPAEIIEGGPCPQEELTIEDLFAALFEKINGLNVNKGIKNSLTVKITQVFEKYSKSNLKTALNNLNAFYNHVISLYSGGVITAQDKDLLLELTASLADALTNAAAKELPYVNKDIPDTFALEQNYPNPFNPSTIIRFSVPEAAFVRVSVFDVLGKEISVLVNSQMQPGIYEYEFNADGLSSGIYFYKITAGEFSSFKKMQFMK